MGHSGWSSKAKDQETWVTGPASSPNRDGCCEAVRKQGLSPFINSPTDSRPSPRSYAKSPGHRKNDHSLSLRGVIHSFIYLLPRYLF